MSRKVIRTILAVTVLTVTIAVFIYYIYGHPETIRQLKDLPLSLIGGLLLLYCAFMVTLVWNQRATLKLCEVELGRKEGMLLVMYSSIINFFGPLQSGPAFRAAYLKKKHNLNLKRYTLATLLYYGFYALFSGVFILTYFAGPWALLASFLAVAFGPVIIRKRSSLVPARFRKLNLQHIGGLARAALAQVSVLAVIFYVELNSLGQHVAALPSLIYTGAANFALFVSVTPGAIGFRESFVIFTQGLHDIASSQIVTASLIDRGVYILFLGILAVIIFGFHTGDLLKLRSPKNDGDAESETGN